MSTKHKNRSYSYSSKKQGRSNLASALYMFPILMIAGFLPILMRLKVYKTNLTQYAWFFRLEPDEFVDFFLYYRQWLFVGMAAIMFVVLCVKAYFDRKTLKLSKTCIPLGVYALLALLSTIFSDHARFGFSGIFEQFENVFMLMGYALLVYYMFLMIQEECEVRWIIFAFAVSALVLGMIGTGQTFGHDFIASDFGKAFIVGGTGRDLATTMGVGRAYMTLYNPNYVGVYVAMALPFLLTLLIFSREWKKSCLYGVGIVLLVISLYGSGSKAGFLILLAVILFLLFIIRRPILKQWFWLIPAFTAMVCTFLTINNYRDYKYTNAIMAALHIEKTPEFALSAMTTDQDGVHLTYQGNDLNIAVSVELDTVFFEIDDGKGNTLIAVPSEDGASFTIDDERYSSFVIQPMYYGNALSFSITIDGHSWYFTNCYDDTGMYYRWTAKGQADRMEMADSAVFTEYGRAFSGRGYIWSRTIPLLKKYILLGSGADTFSFAFPQQDSLRLYQFGYDSVLMSKPHCMYLQVAVQTGVLSLIALLVFYGMYFVTSMKLYLKSRFQTFYSQVGVACFLSTLGYMGSCISNDSSTATAPLFWLLIGLGVAINSKVKAEAAPTDAEVKTGKQDKQKFSSK